MVMTVYLAARYEWKEYMCEVADQLSEAGVEVTSRWIRGDDDGMKEIEAAERDLEDLTKADTLVFFSYSETGGAGRHIEFGGALLTRKRIFIVGERESIFHHLPQVVVCSTVDELISHVMR